MNSSIGINQNQILYYLNKIRVAWTHYFWESKVCQSHIKFTQEEKSNYTADLLSYFEDTVHLLSQFKINDNYRSALYDAVATLQFMYVEQDLVDDLLALFNLPTSLSTEKGVVRKLRNELIGHPISRTRDKKLISSVFIANGTQGLQLEYINYHRDNDFKFQIKKYSWVSIFEAHEKYLLIYLGKILERIIQILEIFKTELKKLQESIPNYRFDELVCEVNNIFDSYHRDSSLFTKENILYCYLKFDQHGRYELAVNSYVNRLKETITETVNNIDIFGKNDYQCVNEIIVQEPLKIKFNTTITYTDPNEVIVTYPKIAQQPKKDYHYELGKLSERHPVFGIAYFKNEFSNDSEILEELDNMDVNSHNDAEYYSSFDYLKKLLKDRHLLSDLT